ncbi:MAG TPA: hypothetical protein PKK05_22065, partial [Leptospiraceae bacterium]|nr:hypothetical protein [Leptospiraceae bacterium]
LLKYNKEFYFIVRLCCKFILEYKYDPDKTPLKKDNKAYQKIKEEHTKEKVYFTHDNGGRPFAVYISKERISVFRFLLLKSLRKRWRKMPMIHSMKMISK